MGEKLPPAPSSETLLTCATVWILLHVPVYRENTYIEVLDSTRIHPETYVWARKMAVDALEYDEVRYQYDVCVCMSECVS